MTGEERLEIAKNFVAYGEPGAARVAVIGYEEGGVQWGVRDPAVDDGELELRRGGYRAYETHPSSTPAVTERMEAHFCLNLRKKWLGDIQGDDLVEYYRREFCRGFEMAGNLFPFSRPRNSAPWGDTADFFGLTKPAFLALLDPSTASGHDFLGLRLQVLGRLRDTLLAGGSRAVLLFMGVKRFEQEIVTALRPGNGSGPYQTSDRYGRKKTRYFRVYAGDPALCFVQHPSGGWFFDAVADDLVKHLAEDRIQASQPH